LDTIEPTTEYWGAVNPPPNIHISMDTEFKKKWTEAYQEDPEFNWIMRHTCGCGIVETRATLLQER
jgi:hypothetical protein